MKTMELEKYGVCEIKPDTQEEITGGLLATGIMLGFYEDVVHVWKDIVHGYKVCKCHLNNS